MLAKNIKVGDKLKMLHDRHSSKGNIVIQAGSIVEVLEIDKSDCMVQLLIRQPNPPKKLWTSTRDYEKVPVLPAISVALPENIIVKGNGGGSESPAISSEFPQDAENNEYRYIVPDWLNEIAIGLTAGAIKHPGETWRDIPADEHLARALRHINLYRMGDRSENHLINSAMRLMLAFATQKGDE